MNFVAVLNELGVPMAPGSHHHSRHGWIQFDCPYCAPRTGKWHMGYRISGRYVNCWRCGRHDLVDTLLNLGCANKTAAIRYARALPQDRAVKRQHSGTLKEPKHRGPMTKAHRRYLHGRDFDPDEIAALWGVQGIGLASRFKWSLYIPIYLDGEVVSFTTRQLHDDGVRYVTAKPEEEAVHHKDILYGEDMCRNDVVVFEGVTDVWRFGPGSVCTFGVNWSEEMLYRLSRYRNRFVCFDPEGPAQKRARALVDSLSAFDGDTYNIILGNDESEKTDMGSMSYAFVQAMRHQIFGEER